ncbi:MAG TPA: alpha/beta fold hydrolase [Vicinamibacterales bacterium]|jgi:dienelactone hydrolase|nr:alpha/beta fold hydrolase [Vicinamibacterales bacterium]
MLATMTSSSHLRVFISAVAACGFVSFAFAQQTPAPPNPPHETFFYTSDGLRLEAYLYKPEGPGPFPLVVYNHGSRAGEERTERPIAFIARLLLPAGYAVLVPERRGYGKSEGKTFVEEIGNDRGPRFVARLDAEAKDALAAVDAVAHQPGSSIDVTRVAIMGWSFGGIVTTLAASGTDRFRVAIIQAPGALNWDRSPDLRSALTAAARKIRVPSACAVAKNDLTTESARSICETIKKNGTVTDLRIYGPFTPTQPPAGIPPGHLIFGPEGVSIWSEDALTFLAAHMSRP